MPAALLNEWYHTK